MCHQNPKLNPSFFRGNLIQNLNAQGWLSYITSLKRNQILTVLVAGGSIWHKKSNWVKNPMIADSKISYPHRNGEKFYVLSLITIWSYKLLNLSYTKYHLTNTPPPSSFCKTNKKIIWTNVIILIAQTILRNLINNWIVAGKTTFYILQSGLNERWGMVFFYKGYV